MAKKSKNGRLPARDTVQETLSARADLSKAKKRIAELESNSALAEALARCNALEEELVGTKADLSEQRGIDLKQIAKDFRQGGRKVNRELAVEVEGLMERIAQRQLNELEDRINNLVDSEAQMRDATISGATATFARAKEAVGGIQVAADQTLALAELKERVADLELKLFVAKRDGVVPPWLVPLWGKYQDAKSNDERRRYAGKLSDRMVDLARWQLGQEAFPEDDQHTVTVTGTGEAVQRFVWYASFGGMGIDVQSDKAAAEAARCEGIIKAHDEAKKAQAEDTK